MKIDVGCGYCKLAGFIGVDIIKTPVVDVIADTNHMPFKKGSFYEVYMSHVLEHTTDPNAVMKEVQRIAIPGAKITIRVPHAFTHSSFLNPTHRIHFLIGTILYWTEFREFGSPMFVLDCVKLSTGRALWNCILNIAPNLWEHLVFPIWLLNPEIVYQLRRN